MTRFKSLLTAAAGSLAVASGSAHAALPENVDTALDNIAVDVAAAGAIMLLGVVAVMVVKYIMAVII